MNREEQIKAIYEKIADKTLSFGCTIYVQEVVKGRDGKLIQPISSIRKKTILSKGCMGVYSVGYKDEYFHSTDTICRAYNSEDFLMLIEKREGVDERSYYIKKIIGHSVMIGDVLDYIDRNLFRNPSKYEGVFEIDIQAREKCVISLYNHFIGKYRSPVEKQSDDCIDYIYNLIKE